MAHFVFMAPPATGHINPTLGLVSALVRRRHRVSYFVTEEHEGRVKEAGAEPVPYETTMPGSGAKPLTLSGFDVTRGLLAGLRETRHLSESLDAWFTRNRPDVVVFDGLVAWWGRLLAYRHGIPAVPSWPNFVSNDAWSLTDEYVKFNKLDPRLYGFILRIRRMAIKEGLTLVELMDSLGRGVPEHLVFLPREFQFEGHTFDESFRFVGPCLREGRGDEGWTPPPGRPVLLVSLGTLYHNRPDFFRDVIQAFGDSPWHVVLVIGRDVDPAVLGEIPRNCEVHATVPQLEVLGHARLFLTHAGMGSVMESLSFGVPMIAAPQMGEQRANADRVEQLNLGRVLREGAEDMVDHLRRLADEISTDDTVRTSVEDMRRAFERAGGVEAAVRVVEGAVNARVR